MSNLINCDEAIAKIEKSMCEDGFRSGTGLVHKTTVYEILRSLPDAQPNEDKRELTRAITAGIIATNTKDVYSCGMRNGMRWCRALIDDKRPEFEDASQYVPKTFAVIDTKTGKEVDAYEIALHEDWAKKLTYTQYMDGFAIMQDGSLILGDECGNFVYCPEGRFEVRWDYV